MNDANDAMVRWYNMSRPVKTTSVAISLCRSSRPFLFLSIPEWVSCCCSQSTRLTSYEQNTPPRRTIADAHLLNSFVGDDNGCLPIVYPIRATTTPSRHTTIHDRSCQWLTPTQAFLHCYYRANPATGGLWQLSESRAFPASK